MENKEEYEVNKRVRILRDSLGMGRAAFADITGLEKRTIENIEHERQKVYAWHIQKIGNIFPNYSTWLAYGKTSIGKEQIEPIYIVALENDEGEVSFATAKNAKERDDILKKLQETKAK